MNVKNKYLFSGLLLLILSPTAMAAPAFYYNDYVKSYSNCSVKLLDDNSVEVSFQANLADHLFNLPEAGKHLEQWKKLIKIDRPIPLSRKNALLSLYFYHADGSPNTHIQLNDISHLALNGSTPKSASNRIQDIRFESDSAPFNRTHYSVSFNVSANTLKSIRIGATVGGILIAHSTKQEYPLFSSRGISFSPTGHQCASFDPQSGIAPQALKVDPKFHLASTVWQLASLDLDHLLENTAEGRGLDAPMINPQANRFCINYHAMGTQDTRYMISANNRNGLSTSGQQFKLIEKSGSNVINYHVELEETGRPETSISLPKERKFIQLKNNNGGMEQMCWSPKVLAYSTKTTDKGSYSDTLYFTITPQS
ncbi:hypothetical protein ymoll0001_36930 [Yersinia mollaretii ATCC 43969]|uniref:Alpha-related fimbriae major subunit n=1 Tax=Yersinia mollaretii (strain ATCC 43969 / DSM 18520 / CIP 103324 / CNY 7263 / WAIP 204) TaxID=349967 RepID=A0ABM9Y7Y5_YERMW|nr:hypothetical protein [Yersinia mollaretii]EEQ09945.1 hypothetical protein ymoll0001_36930 [Yersinia mollaretii ATCC 43969]QKJ02223.1 hypothetical protein HRD69_04005 [Yersinia mollaretii ATCC 43969]